MLSSFHKFFAIRIALISVLVSAIAGVISYYVVRDNMITMTRNYAIEDSKRALVNSHQKLALTPDNIYVHAKSISENLVGGLFEHAEVYDAHETLVAEAGYSDQTLSEVYKNKHSLPASKEPISYLQTLSNGEKVLTVFLPIKGQLNGRPVLVGYIEMLRHIPQWRIEVLKKTCLKMALMTFGLALLFSALLYPVVISLFKSYRTKLDEVHTSHILLLEALGHAIAMRDSETGIHNFRVTYIAVKIAEELELSNTETQRVILGSFLHDIGKISVPDSILLKEGKLTDDERSQMQAHVGYGTKIVGNMGWIQDAGVIIANHHEKWDGSGYPKGLREDQIPLEARVFAVADVFDALCSKRPYKEAMNFRDAMKVIDEGNGNHFDPLIVEAFKPISHKVYDFITSVTEHDGKLILDKLIKKYFE